MRLAAPALLLLVLAAACGPASHSVSSGNSVNVTVQDGSVVRLQAVGPKTIRVSTSPDGVFNDRQSLAVVSQKPYSSYQVVNRGSKVRLSTAELTAEVSKLNGTVSFYDASGNLLTQNEPAEFVPIDVEGKNAYSTTIRFSSTPDESFYGLGQHQSGELDHKGKSEELYQYNTKVSVPMVVSTKGYGLMFDAYSQSRWGNPQPYRQLGEIFKLYDDNLCEGHLTGDYTTPGGRPFRHFEDSLCYENEFQVKNIPHGPFKDMTVYYEGFIEAPETADYHFVQYYAGWQRTEIGGKEVMSRRWRPAWNPNSYKFTVHLEAGKKTPIKVEWQPDGDVSYFSLKVAPLQTPEEEAQTCFWSEFEPYADYYFIAGDNYDDVIHGYRTLTGKSPVVPKWVLGFWQSRERYSTQDELVGTLAQFRERHIPVDNIVQDWMYWEPDQWGSHEFDSTRYPDPEKMMDDVHAMNGRLMISVWPKFYTNTEHYKELKAAGYAFTHAEDVGLVDWLGHEQTFYDAYAEGGRKMFWRQIDETLYSRSGQKIDAWWMDASEPNLRDCLPMDYFKWLISPTALGPSTEYLNAYSIVNADAIYNGQRSVVPDKRVFLLTRSGFLGEQRYSTATWSGDIGTSWTDMRIQMAAGLGFSMSGIPFWGMDIGGFSVMDKFYSPAGADEWQELQTRWHQFGAFVPLFRAHGQWPQRELWNIAPEGSEAYESILWYMKLRYNLMPYLYSLAGAVRLEDYTMMRGLPMDWPDDMNVRDLSDQWMFGPAFMPCPVSEYQARSRSAYFPEGGWYDFYTGTYIDGNQRLTVDAPYSRMPLYVRAGSIVPFGPDMEWSDQKSAVHLHLYVYAGSDADFTLYEDDGLTYDYENGAFSTIPIHWNNASRTLEIGARNGIYDGMLTERAFTVVVIDPSHSSTFSPDAPGREVLYSGSRVTVNL